MCMSLKRVTDFFIIPILFERTLLYSKPCIEAVAAWFYAFHTMEDGQILIVFLALTPKEDAYRSIFSYWTISLFI